MSSGSVVVVLLCVLNLLVPCYAFDWSSYLSEDSLPGDQAKVPDRAQFEAHFPGDVNFRAYPFLGHLYRIEETARERFHRLTVIVLKSLGKAGLPTKDVAKEIAKDRHQPAKWNKYRIVYRCYPTGHRGHFPDEYTVRSAPIEEMTLQRGEWILSFTEDSDPSCAPEYEPEGATVKKEDMAKNTHQLEAMRSLVLVERGLPLTRRQFEAAFPSKATLDSNPDQTYLFRRKMQATQDKTTDSYRELIPKKDCLVKLYPNGKGTLLSTCAHSVVASREFYESFGTFLLPYRCFKSASPDDYELLNATITGIAREDGENVLYFKAKKTEHCRINWNQESEEEEEALPEADYVPEGTVPLGKDAWKGLFVEENGAYRKLPYTGMLVERDPKNASNPNLVPIVPCLALMMKFNEAIVILPPCMDYLAQRMLEDPKLSTIALAYRCFLSPNADHYELYNEVHTARITDIDARVGGTLLMDCLTNGKLTGGKCHQMLYFAAYIRQHCQIIGKEDAPAEADKSLEQSVIKEAGQVKSKLFPEALGHTFRENAALESEQLQGDYLPPGTVPVSLERHRQLFDVNLPVEYATLPYIAYLYEKDPLNGANEELMPIRPCFLYLTRPNEAVSVMPPCMDILAEREKTQSNFSSLTMIYRCYFDEKKRDEYELHSAKIVALGPRVGGNSSAECTEDGEASGSCRQTLFFADYKHAHCRMTREMMLKQEVNEEKSVEAEKKSEESMTDQGDAENEGEDGDYLPDGSVALRKERFRELCDVNLPKGYGKVPSIGFLFQRHPDEPKSRQLEPIWSCMGIISPGNIIAFGEQPYYKALFLTAECLDFLAERQKTDPKLSSLALVYRCFTSKDPAHFEEKYEVHSAPIVAIGKRKGPAQCSEDTGECRQALTFTAPKRPSCTVLTTQDAPKGVYSQKETPRDEL